MPPRRVRWIPLETDHRRRVPSAGTGPARRRPGVAVVSARILVVDDTPQNIKLLDALLTPRGHEVITANSGEEALEKVASANPDLVLLDIVMPGMDGYEVCRRLREDDSTALLPVV